MLNLLVTLGTSRRSILNNYDVPPECIENNTFDTYEIDMDGKMGVFTVYPDVPLCLFSHNTFLIAGGNLSIKGILNSGKELAEVQNAFGAVGKGYFIISSTEETNVSVICILRSTSGDHVNSTCITAKNFKGRFGVKYDLIETKDGPMISSDSYPA